MCTSVVPAMTQSSIAAKGMFAFMSELFTLKNKTTPLSYNSHSI